MNVPMIHRNRTGKLRVPKSRLTPLRKYYPEPAQADIDATLAWQKANQDAWLGQQPRTAQDMLVELLRLGCGAIVGETACDQPAAGLMTGQSPLKFQTMRGCWLTNGETPSPATQYVVALCGRHYGDGQTRSLVMDMGAEVHAQQMAACSRWLASFGKELATG